MASYNKGKLIALLERRRAAFSTLRDYSDRARDASGVARKRADQMMANADHYSSRNVVDKLLRLSADDAAKLTQAQVEEYEVTGGNVTTTRLTGIKMGSWNEYLALRAKADRLGAEEARVSEGIQQQFAVLPGLLEAVKKWGFADPEMEVI